MRKMFSLVLILILGTLGRAAAAGITCPGVGACVYDATCPRRHRGELDEGAAGGDQEGPLLRRHDLRPARVYLGKIDFKGKAITIKSTGGAGVTFLDGGGTGRW